MVLSLIFVLSILENATMLVLYELLLTNFKLYNMYTNMLLLY